MNSRKQFPSRTPVSPVFNLSQFRTQPQYTVISPVYQNKTMTVIDSPLNRHSSIQSLPFQSITNTNIPQSNAINETFKKKPKQLKNINKSLTVNQPSLNTSIRNRSYLSNQNNNSTINKTEVSEENNYRQDDVNQSEKEECLLSTILPSPQKYFIKPKFTQHSEDQQHKFRSKSKQLFDEVSYRMVESNILTQFNANHIQMEQSVILERQFMQNFTILKQIKNQQYISVENKLKFCLVTKIVSIQKMSQIVSQLKQIKIQHPILLRTYQCVINNNNSFVILKQYYDSYFYQNLGKYSHDQILACIQDVISFFQYLYSKRTKYTEKLFTNIVMANYVPKILFTSDSVCKSNEDFTRTECYEPLIEFISNILEYTRSKTMKAKLESIYNMLTNGCCFSEFLKNNIFKI